MSNREGERLRGWIADVRADEQCGLASLATGLLSGGCGHLPQPLQPSPAARCAPAVAGLLSAVTAGTFVRFTVPGIRRRTPLPATCWHVAVHPREDRFYALSFRVLPQEGHDWHEWAMAYLKEYVFEIDAEQGRVLRHWTAPT
ncbi:hypothetical protein [Streptomyces decoyicus]